MQGGNYGKYIIDEMKAPSKLSVSRHMDPTDLPPKQRGRIQVVYLDNDVLAGGTYTECVWIMPGKHFPGVAEQYPHYHDFDEVVSFIGTDLDKPWDLGGEIEFWIEGEKHLLTRSCLINLPRGTKHCPLIMRRVDRPIYHAAVGTGSYYLQNIDEVDRNDPRYTMENLRK
jgi:hypothetical protein